MIYENSNQVDNRNNVLKYNTVGNAHPYMYKIGGNINKCTIFTGRKK